LAFNCNEFLLFPLRKVYIVLGTCIGPVWRLSKGGKEGGTDGRTEGRKESQQLWAQVESDRVSTQSHKRNCPTYPDHDRNYSV